jgi:hypothetical protein
MRMTSPVSRPQISTAQLAVIQARPVQRTAPQIASEQPQPPEPAAQPTGTAPLRRGSLINIVA